MKLCHKENVQQNVGGCGANHGNQRRTAVSYRAEKARKQVESHDHGNAAEDDPQVNRRQLKGIFRGVQQVQNRHQQHLGDDLQQYHHRCGKHDALPGGQLQSRVILRAETLSNHDGKALCQTHCDGKHRPIQPPGRGYSRQRRNPLDPADHQRIHQIIHLLKQIACNNRQGEEENQLGNAAFRQIFRACHGNLIIDMSSKKSSIQSNARPA